MIKVDFNGKRILVTGGTRGIGRSIVEAFLESGGQVALHGSHPESVDSGNANRFASRTVWSKQPVALATVEGCRRVVETAISGLGGLDVLVNNAGRWNTAGRDGRGDRLG